MLLNKSMMLFHDSKFSSKHPQLILKLMTYFLHPYI